MISKTWLAASFSKTLLAALLCKQWLLGCSHSSCSLTSSICHFSMLCPAADWHPGTWRTPSCSNTRRSRASKRHSALPTPRCCCCAHLPISHLLSEIAQAGGRLAPGHVAYTILVNQTAIHGVPAALNAANTALLRAFTGNANASMQVTNHPLPTVASEDAVKVSQMSGKSPHLQMVWCRAVAQAVGNPHLAVDVVRALEVQARLASSQ